jgi:hypothetical protein
VTNDELDRALRQLRLGGMADTLTVRAQERKRLAQSTFLACSFPTSCRSAAIDSSSDA